MNKIIPHSRPNIFKKSYFDIFWLLKRRKLDTKYAEENIANKLKSLYTLDNLYFTDCGKSSLVLCLLNNWKIGKDEVIMSPYNCEDIYNVFNFLNLKIIFGDVDEFGQLNLKSINKYITERTGYIFISNNFGKIKKNESLDDITIIEDCTHSILSSNNKENEIIISFGATKPLTGGGGGAYITNKILNNQAKKYIQLNNGINDLNFSILNNQIDNLSKIKRKRQKTYYIYSNFFETKNIDYLEFNSNEIPYRFVIKINNKSCCNLKYYLNKSGIRAEFPITPPIVEQEDFKKSILSLPMYYGISTKEIKYILKNIERVLMKNGI